MIVDASALLAIILDEADAERFAIAIAGARAPLISAINFWEVAVRVDRSERPTTLHKFDALMEYAELTTAPVTSHQATIARRAYSQYGKGRHPAQLNLGDCFAYALAKDTRRPLLFKGNDFVHTDIETAI